MRIIWAGFYNFIQLVLATLAIPFKLLLGKPVTAYVYYRLKGDPAYRKSMTRGRSLFRRRERKRSGLVVDLQLWQEQLNLLSIDPKVEGMVLEFDGLEVSAAKRDAIGQIIRRFKAAGKKSVAFAVTFSNAEYALACQCDRIVLAPGGRVELTGYSAELTALGDALKHLGVGAHFVRRADYKTMPELFTHREPSPAQKQTAEAIIDQRYLGLLRSLVEGRKFQEAEAKRKIDLGPYGSKRALTEGLCDAVASRSELPSCDDRTTPDEAMTSFEAWVRKRAFYYRKFLPLKRRSTLAIIPLDGMIVQGDGGMTPLGKSCGSTELIDALRKVRRSSTVKAAVLYVRSPGGGAVASDLILEEIKKLAKEIPVVAYFDQVAASGGYLVSLGAQEMWADSTAVVGSIGVFAGKFEFSELFKRWGIHRSIIQRGDNASRMSASRPFTQHEKTSLEAEVEEIYQSFVEEVARARRRNKDEILNLAQGKVYTGDQALAVGLVDGLCDFEGACRRAIELAKSPTDDFKLKMFTPAARRGSIISSLLQFNRSMIFTLDLDVALGIRP